jgi:amino acid adenylation domain-containing protein
MMKENGNMSDAARRQAVLEKLLKRKLPGDFKTKSLPKRKIHSPVPVSFAQQRLWVLDRLVPDNSFYNIPTALRIKGELDIPAFERAVNEMIRRHESLRTVFKMENEEPVQVIRPEFSLRVEVKDLGSLPAGEKEKGVKRLMAEESGKPFDLEHGPLLRVLLLIEDPNTTLLIYSMHHIISDAWSMELFKRELVTIYEAYLAGKPSPLPEPPVQYADFAVWQREWLQGEALQKQLSYWKNMLGGDLPVLEMPSDRPRPAISSYRGNFQNVVIPEKLTEKLMVLNRRQGCSMFMTLFSAFNVLLYRYSGQEDILVGSPIANRKRPELEEIIGFFINTLVLRTDLSGNPTFLQLMERIRQVSSGAYDNQDLPFEKLVEELQPDRYMNHNPLFQAMLVLQNVPRQEIRMEDKKFQVGEVPAFSGSVKFDIWVSLTQYDKLIVGTIEYSTDLFEDETISRLWRHYLDLLETIVLDPGQPIDSISFLGAEEKEQLLNLWNDTGRTYPVRLLHHAFAEQVEKSPDGIAVIDPFLQISYRELQERSGRLAGVLIEKALQPDAVVGIKAERSVAMVLGMMGILNAGGAYLPIDPELPQERIDYMLNDSGTGILLTAGDIESGINSASVSNISTISPGTEKIPAIGHRPPATTYPTLQNLAYVIYTSGSTGKPKGVMVPHRGVSNRLRWMQEAYGLTGADRVLQKTPFSFDVSVWEFFWTLLSGALLVMARPGGHKDSAYLVETINREKITTLHFVPTMLQVFLEDPGIGTIGSLKRVICSGEALPPEYRDRFFGRFGAAVELHNLYGPTEASVDVTSWACAADSQRHTVPIGKPIANTQIYILDRHSNLAPIGVHGELHIGGIQLARGYLNRPELTAEKFCLWPPRKNVSNKTLLRGVQGGGILEKSPPGRRRLYKTGDLARWQPDGNIEYIGRLDFQVKVRGFRIELGEIESQLRNHEAVFDAAVLVREDLADTGQKKLVGYVVPDYRYFQEKAPGEIVSEDLAGEQVTDWQKVFDDTYGKEPGQEDPTFNIAGWNSSYTGAPLPAEEMRAWVDNTVQRILSLKPQHIMEIGCGTGLFLFKLVPHCRRYLGTDIARQGLNYIGSRLEQIKQPGWAEVQLLERSADNFDGLGPGKPDLVILNSVVQYFPSADYLVEVVEKAAQQVKPGGHIFIGDVRSLPLLKTFHASVESHRAEPGAPGETILRSVLNKVSLDQELVIEPRFFDLLVKRVPRVKHAEVLVKYGRYANELSKFRYDVILHLGTGNRDLPRLHPDLVLDWKQEKAGLRGVEDIRALLAGLAKEKKEPGCLVVTSVPNARVAQDLRTLKGLMGIDEPGTPAGLHPDDVLALEAEFPYRVSLLVSPLEGEEGSFDVVFTHNRGKKRAPGAVLAEFHPVPATEDTPGWSSYTNNPLLVKISGQLVPQLRNFLRDRLPEYMVPAHLVLLPRLPVTSTGKLDRQALPEPVRVLVETGEDFVEPSTETEIRLAQFWKEILHLDKVSIHHNFFELGGDSVNAIQMASRANKQGMELSVQLLFRNQTIADLANALDKVPDEAAKPVKPVKVGEAAYEEFRALLDMEVILKQLPDGIEIEDIYPATPLQLHQVHFFNTEAFEEPPLFLYQRTDHPMNMPLDVEALKKALQLVAERNTLLRTLLLWKDLPEPIQVVCRELSFDFVYLDLSAVPPERKNFEINEWLKKDWNNTFDRTNSSPMRVGIFKLAENSYQYYFTGDYMRMEGWSANIFIGEIFNFYGIVVTGAPIPPLQSQTNCYKEYLHTLRNLDKKAAVQYWREVFKGFDGVRSLTALPGNQTGQGTGFAISHFYLTPEMSARLEQLLLENRLSLSVFFQGTYAALLGHYLRQDRVIYGMVTTGRSVPIAGIEDMRGHSINVLPVAVPISKEKLFPDYLKEIWEIQTEWTRHDYTQIDKIHEWCDLPARQPLFDNYIVIQNLASVQGEIRGGQRDGTNWKRNAELMFAKMEYPLRLDVFSGYEYCFTFQYFLRFFTAPAVKGLMDNLKTLIETAIENPHQTVTELLGVVETGKYQAYENDPPEEFVQL